MGKNKTKNKKVKGGAFLRNTMRIPEYLYKTTQNTHNAGRELFGKWVYNPISESWEFLQGEALRMYNLFSDKPQNKNNHSTRYSSRSKISDRSKRSKQSRSIGNMRLQHELPERSIRNRLFSYRNQSSESNESNISSLSSNSETGIINSQETLDNHRNSQRSRLNRVTQRKVRKTTTIYRLIVIFTTILTDSELTALNKILIGYNTDYHIIYRGLTYLLNKISFKINLYKKDKSLTTLTASLSSIENDLTRLISEMSKNVYKHKLDDGYINFCIKSLKEIVRKYHLHIMTYSHSKTHF